MSRRDLAEQERLLSEGWAGRTVCAQEAAGPQPGHSYAGQR